MRKRERLLLASTERFSLINRGCRLVFRCDRTCMFIQMTVIEETDRYRRAPERMFFFFFFLFRSRDFHCLMMSRSMKIEFIDSHEERGRTGIIVSRSSLFYTGLQLRGRVDRSFAATFLNYFSEWYTKGLPVCRSFTVTQLCFLTYLYYFIEAGKS